MSKSEQQLLEGIFGGEYKPSEKQISMGGKSIHIKYCGCCDSYYIECPRCGNNCCNDGAGAEEDGTQCILCQTSYALQNLLGKNPEFETLIELMLSKGTLPEERKKFGHWSSDEDPSLKQKE